MRANAPRPICSSRARSRARCAASLRPARSLFPERTTVRLTVIGAVALHLVRPLARAAAPAPDRRDTLDQRQQLRDVVSVRPRQTHRERDAFALDQQVVLAAQLGAIYGAFPGLLAAVTSPDAGTVNDGALPREPPLGLKFREDALPQPAPDAPRMPLKQSAAAGMPRREVTRRREVLPRHAGLEGEDDAGHHLARVGRLTPRVPDVTPLLRLREQRLDALPQLLGEDRVGHTVNPFV
jgi:hypothetical protein